MEAKQLVRVRWLRGLEDGKFFLIFDVPVTRVGLNIRCPNPSQISRIDVLQ
jgi:hypothetical protein